MRLLIITPVFGTTTKISGHKPVEFAGEQTIEFVILSIPLLVGTCRAVVFVVDEHAPRPINKLSSASFMIESIPNLVYFGLITFGVLAMHSSPLLSQSEKRRLCKTTSHKFHSAHTLLKKLGCPE